MWPSDKAVNSIDKEELQFYKYVQFLGVTKVTEKKTVLKFRGRCPRTIASSKVGTLGAAEEGNREYHLRTSPSLFIALRPTISTFV